MAKIFINGLGKIGRALLRELIANPPANTDLMGFNDRNSADNIVYALQHDTYAYGLNNPFNPYYPTISGNPGHTVQVDSNGIDLLIDSKPIIHRSETDVSLLRLGDLGVEYVIDCSGALGSLAAQQGFTDAGAKGAIGLYEAYNDRPNIIMGCNEKNWDGSQNFINIPLLTVPIAAVLKPIYDNSWQLDYAVVNAISSYDGRYPLNDTLVYTSGKTPRTPAQNIIYEKSSGGIKGLGLVLPSYNGKVIGSNIVVNLLSGSLTTVDIHLSEVRGETEVAALYKVNSGDLYDFEQSLGLTPADILGTPRPVIVPTWVQQGETSGDTIVRVNAYYDSISGTVSQIVRAIEYLNTL